MNWRYNEQKEQWVNLDHIYYIDVKDWNEMSEVIAHYNDGDKKSLMHTPVRKNAISWLREFIEGG